MTALKILAALVGSFVAGFCLVWAALQLGAWLIDRGSDITHAGDDD